MKFKYIPPLKCIKCSKELKSIHGDDYEMISGGIVGRVFAPYGSRNDGFVYQIGICDDCLDASPEAVFIGNYIDGVKIEDLKKQREDALDRHDVLRPVFEKLKNDWAAETRFDSFHYPLKDSAKKIVAMGFSDALPFIMEEMAKDPPTAHWFVLVIELLKDQNIKAPEIPEEIRGKVKKQTSSFLFFLEVGCKGRIGY